MITGRRLHRTHLTPLPMPDEVKSWVHDLAWTTLIGLCFTDFHNNNLDLLDPEELKTDILGF